jgi:hypothetical protein
MTATEGFFVLVLFFCGFLFSLMLGRFLFWLASFFVDQETDFPVDSGLRKSDVGRANSIWGDKD